MVAGREEYQQVFKNSFAVEDGVALANMLLVDDQSKVILIVCLKSNCFHFFEYFAAVR